MCILPCVAFLIPQILQHNGLNCQTKSNAMQMANLLVVATEIAIMMVVCIL